MITRIIGIALLAASTTAAAPAQEPTPALKFEVTTRLVVVNVEVKDRNGNPVEGLRAEDFEVFEDKKPQKISVFEYQRLSGAPEPLPASPKSTAPRTPRTEITPSREGQIRYRDRRLIVLFFDLSSMEPADRIRARGGAERFIEEKMTPEDLMAVMTFSTELRVLQDFTSDRETLRQIIQSLRLGESSDLAGEAPTGSDDTTQDTGAAFTADETEFNIFNTDSKLSALEDATRMLASLPEKKALVYFSSGVGRTGTENQSQLRATVNAAVKANVAFYPVDARGLVAEAPLGDTRQGGTRGSGMYSGASQRQRGGRFHTEQETLFTLAADTGGKALLDSNDLALGIVQAQENISSYYILGYYSTNPAEDGRYRRIDVRVRSVKKATLDYRRGYFAAKRFENFTAADKERQLEEALMLGDPITDLHLALEVNYFLRARDRYLVPVSVKIPGSEIETVRKKNNEVTRLDFIGEVRGRRGLVMGNVRDHIQVKVNEQSGKLEQRQLQYDTAFTLPPGDYTLKFLVRENQTGKMGTFETRFSVPDISKEKEYLRMSSVVWANQREPLAAAVGAAEKKKKLIREHPLVRNGEKLVPSITKVFRKDQTLSVFFEVYNPGLDPAGNRTNLAVDLSFFRGDVKAFESEAVRPAAANSKESRLVPVEFEIPLESLQSGRYICQLNVIDEAGRRFAFRRTPLVLLP